MRLKGKHELCLCEYHRLFPLIALINDVTQYACTSNLQIYLYNLYINIYNFVCGQQY